MHKSKMVQLDSLNHISTNNFNIALIQEPHIDYLIPVKAWQATAKKSSGITNQHEDCKWQSTMTQNQIIGHCGFDNDTSIGCNNIYNIYLDSTHSDKLIPLHSTREARQNEPSYKQLNTQLGLEIWTDTTCYRTRMEATTFSLTKTSLMHEYS